jgi:NSS family neurotransmitter:Na+ symporter
MSSKAERVHETWNSRWTFVMAATGSAVGLGNIWKFPYIAGENGGGAFVFVYLICILILGIPIMMAEVLMGRWGRSSPVHSMYKLVDEIKAPRIWHGIGWMGVGAGIIILSYYSVIAGWAIHYLIQMATGTINGLDGAGSNALFGDMLGSPSTLIFYHSLFMIMTIFVIIAGVTKGLGRAVRILMPLLMVLLLVLLVFSIRMGDFGAAVNYLFAVDFSSLTGQSILTALGHAFFTLSLGMGSIMVYGAYMPDHAPIGKTVLTVAGLDTLVALVAGLAIFPIVFANEAIVPSEGPGLLFVSLPIAFGNMPGGIIFGFMFFALVTMAAWSSSISLIEPAVAWFVETKKATRLQAGLAFGFICWLLGLGTVFSFGVWEDIRLLGLNFFEFADFLTANIMLPLGGMFMAIFVGWMMNINTVRDELDIESDRIFNTWTFVLRYVSPIAILWVTLEGLSHIFGVHWLSLLNLFN